MKEIDRPSNKRDGTTVIEILVLMVWSFTNIGYQYWTDKLIGLKTAPEAVRSCGMGHMQPTRCPNRRATVERNTNQRVLEPTGRAARAGCCWGVNYMKQTWQVVNEASVSVTGFSNSDYWLDTWYGEIIHMTFLEGHVSISISSSSSVHLSKANVSL